MKRAYLPHLTGIRAIAAYCVLITHSFHQAYTYGDATSKVQYIYLICLANFGMTLFFTLSGFVITYTYYDSFDLLPTGKAIRQFVVARFARLYPLYAITTIYFGYRHHVPLSVLKFNIPLSYITLTQGWFHKELFIFHGPWSVSAEWFFYMCFIFWMCFSKPHESESRALKWTMIGIWGFLAFLAVIFWDRAEVNALLTRSLKYKEHIWYWFSNFSPYIRIGEFIAGACAARMYMIKQLQPPNAAAERRSKWLCMCSIVGIAVFTAINILYAMAGGSPSWNVLGTGQFAYMSFLYFLSINYGMAPFIAYLLYATSKYPNIITRICSTRPLQAGGEISYSLYLVQFLVLEMVFATPIATEPSMKAYIESFALGTFYVVLTTGIAWATYRIIEVPGRHFIRKYLSA